MPVDHDDYDDDDDHIEWADPQIRKDYEAALGRLILAHNSVDRHLTQLIERCLERLADPPALAKLRNGQFAQRLDNLELLKAIPIDLELDHPNLDIERLRALNRERNIVAHGHFEQNPFMGDYELIGNKARHQDYSVERLDGITAELDEHDSRISVLVDFYDPIEEHN